MTTDEIWRLYDEGKIEVLKIPPWDYFREKARRFTKDIEGKAEKEAAMFRFAIMPYIWKTYLEQRGIKETSTKNLDAWGMQWIVNYRKGALAIFSNVTAPMVVDIKELGKSALKILNLWIDLQAAYSRN